MFANIDQQGTVAFLVTEGPIAEAKLDGDIGPAGTTVLRVLRAGRSRQRRGGWEPSWRTGRDPPSAAVRGRHLPTGPR
jgi:hypothetical protein